MSNDTVKTVPVLKARKCLECEASFHPNYRKPDQKFCSSKCCAAFNNRRMTRGAEFYDYFMAMRYNRASHASAMQVLTKMAAAYHDLDDLTRDGRRSYHLPDMSADPQAFDIAYREGYAFRQKRKAEAVT